MAAANQPRIILCASAKPPSGSYAAPAMPSSESSGSISATSAGRRTTCRGRAPRAARLAAGLGERLGHRQQVARLDVARVADPDLLAPPHDRVGAADRQQRGHRVRVVTAHHAERPARVAAARARRARAGSRARSPAAELVGDGRPEEPASDHHDVCALTHRPRVSGTRAGDAAVRSGPLIRSRTTCPVAEEAMVPSPRDDSLFVPSRTTEHARTFVSWPCRQELWGDFLNEAENEYAAVIEAIAGFEPVTVIVPPGAVPRLPVGTAFPVDVAELPIDDSWVRDNGRISRRGRTRWRGRRAVRLQRLGGKFAPFADDALLPARLAQLLGMRVYGDDRRGRRADVRRRGHDDHDGVGPVQPQGATPACHARRSRRCCSRTWGSRR